MIELPHRILIVRLSHLGDVVHALPMFHALREAYPSAEIGWVVQPEFADLLRGLPGLSRILIFERRAGARAWPRLWSQLSAFAPDWTIDAQGNMKSALVTLCSRARRRTGLHRDDWTEAFGARVLNDTAPSLGPGVHHAMERMIGLARHVAPGIAREFVPRIDPALSPIELERGRALMARYFPDVSSRPVILNLATPGDVRSWPVERFESLARLLAGRGESVLVLSGPSEAREGRELEARLSDVPGVRHWIDQRGLRELAAFFREAAERHARVVCCDSGPMHLAAANGLSIVALSGPQDARRTGPWPVPQESAQRNGAHRIVRASDPPSCAPCLSRSCSHPSGPVCMRDIEPGAVASALCHETTERVF